MEAKKTVGIFTPLIKKEMVYSTIKYSHIEDCAALTLTELNAQGVAEVFELMARAREDNISFDYVVKDKVGKLVIKGKENIKDFIFNVVNQTDKMLKIAELTGFCKGISCNGIKFCYVPELERLHITEPTGNETAYNILVLIDKLRIQLSNSPSSEYAYHFIVQGNNNIQKFINELILNFPSFISVKGLTEDLQEAVREIPINDKESSSPGALGPARSKI